MTRRRNVLTTSVLAIFATASASFMGRHPALAQSATAPLASKIFVTVERVHTEKGSSHVDATLATLVKFGDPFSCAATFQGRTVNATGLIRTATNGYYSTQITLGDASDSSTSGFTSHLILKLNEPAVLAGVTDGRSKERFQITLTPFAR
jgi:hypothetical protein